MAKGVTVQIKGLQELGKRLEQLSADIAGKVGRAATAAGANVIKKAAIANAPSDTGNLKKNIISKRIPSGESHLTSEHIVTVRVGKLTEKQKAKGLHDAFYARQVEFGHFRRYVSVPTSGGDWITLKDKPLASPVWVPAQPFLRPAYDNNKTKAIEAMKARIEARLKKAGV